MTKQQKASRVIEWLTESHLNWQGGRPYDHTTHAGRLFVAKLDHDGATRIEVYSLDDLPPWYDAARKYIRKHALPGEWYGSPAFGDWSEAFNETSPARLED